MLRVEFDANGIPLDIPLRYVHGVGRVPAANMPFREQVTDWMTKCETVATDDGIELRTKRAMPEIGNEEAISSCGGSEWGEDVAYVEDEPVRVLRGADEDKTLLPGGRVPRGRSNPPARRRRRHRPSNTASSTRGIRTVAFVWYTACVAWAASEDGRRRPWTRGARRGGMRQALRRRTSNGSSGHHHRRRVGKWTTNEARCIC